jgi:hypothetical protein
MMELAQRRAAYGVLLTRAGIEYDTFSLLWARKSGSAKEDAGLQAWAAALQPFCISEEKVTSHHGLRLKGGVGTRRMFAVSPASLQVLSKAESAFDFSGLWAPEGLTFYKSGKVRYESSAHEERETYLD